MKFLKLFQLFIITVSVLYALLHLTNDIKHKNSREEIYILYIDDTFSDLEIDAIYNAATAWERATHGMINFELAIKTVPEFQPFKMLELAEGMDEFIIWKTYPQSDRLFLFELFEVGQHIAGYAPPGANMVLVPDRTESIKHFTTH